MGEPCENEVQILRNELFALRNRIGHLERLLLNGHNLPAENLNRKSCAFCENQHPIWKCSYFKYLQVADRWTVAKKLKLCFRCLDNTDGHLGKYCPHTRVCRVRGCRLLHHRLLHDPDRRKLRTERHRVTNNGGVQNGYVENLTNADRSGFIESALTPNPSGPVNDAHSLNSYGEDPHAGTTTCDDEIDRHEMDELNRLSMLAETSTEVPFDLIFSGRSSRSKSLKSAYMTLAPSGGDNTEVVSLDSFNSECVAPVEQLEPEAPSGGDMEFLDLFNNQSTVLEGELNIEDPSGAEFEESTDLRLRKESNASTPTCIMSEMSCAGDDINLSYTDSKAEILDSLPWKGQIKDMESPNGGEMEEPEGPGYDSLGASPDCLDSVNKTEIPHAGFSVACDGNSNSKKVDEPHMTTENADDYSWINTRMEHAVKQLSHKYRTKDSSLLDTLNDQIYKLDEEIALLETPAEKLENKSEMDLSLWLMPIRDSGEP